MFFAPKEAHPTNPHFVKTRFAVIIHELLSSPLSSMCLFSGFILYKSLGGTPFQVALLTMLKPSVSLLILYWSASIHLSKNKLMQNLVWSGVLARIPFFIFPWIQSPGLFITSLAFYLFFHRASTPAWVEIMRVNLPTSHRGKIYSFATALAYAEGFLLSFWIGPWLDINESAWRWLYPLAALLGLILTFIQSRLPIYIEEEEVEPPYSSWKSKVTTPWKDALRLMKERADFRRFQMGFFFCGFGLMMAIVVIPIYAVDVLKVSYKELVTALLVCQGFGYVLTARVWGHQLHQVPIFKMMAHVISFFVLFGIFFLFTPISINFLYIAYFIYGIGQAGSRLCWKLSAPIFAKESNSAVFSSINILMVGIRGCIAPLLGSVLCALTSAFFVLILFIILSLIAVFLMIKAMQPTHQIN
ncbi:MAG: hypothetical protein S4CHLAM7_07590 [Chlamydiae bacterium]|nr:hypothetical protein [Chlamydiota bacterium]